jgi:hypothetical protein
MKSLIKDIGLMKLKKRQVNKSSFSYSSQQGGSMLYVLMILAFAGIGMKLQMGQSSSLTKRQIKDNEKHTFINLRRLIRLSIECPQTKAAFDPACAANKKKLVKIVNRTGNDDVIGLRAGGVYTKIGKWSVRAYCKGNKQVLVEAAKKQNVADRLVWKSVYSNARPLKCP